VKLALMHELPPYGLSRPALKKYVIGKDDGRTAVDLK
jgi:hypothetical protein